MRATKSPCMEQGIEQAASTISINANLGVPLFILHPYATLHRPAFSSPPLPHTIPSRCSLSRLQWQLSLTAAERLFRQLPLAYRAVDGGGRLIGMLQKGKARGAGWVGGIGDLFLLPPRNVPSPTCPSRRAIWKWMPRYQIKKSGSFMLNRCLARSSMGFKSLSMTKPECLSFFEDWRFGFRADWSWVRGCSYSWRGSWNPSLPSYQAEGQTSCEDVSLRLFPFFSTSKCGKS